MESEVTVVLTHTRHPSPKNKRYVLGLVSSVSYQSFRVLIPKVRDEFFGSCFKHGDDLTPVKSVGVCPSSVRDLSRMKPKETRPSMEKQYEILGKGSLIMTDTHPIMRDVVETHVGYDTTTSGDSSVSFQSSSRTLHVYTFDTKGPDLHQNTTDVRVLPWTVSVNQESHPTPSHSMGCTQGTDHVTRTPQRFNGGYDHSPEQSHLLKSTSKLSSSDVVSTPDDFERVGKKCYGSGKPKDRLEPKEMN